MKKPFLKFTSRSDRLGVALLITAVLLAASLFFIPGEEIAAMSSGDAVAPRSLFGLISRLA